jgi:hypothetical protein
MLRLGQSLAAPEHHTSGVENSEVRQSFCHLPACHPPDQCVFKATVPTQSVRRLKRTRRDWNIRESGFDFIPGAGVKHLVSAKRGV